MKDKRDRKDYEPIAGLKFQKNRTSRRVFTILYSTLRQSGISSQSNHVSSRRLQRLVVSGSHNRWLLSSIQSSNQLSARRDCIVKCSFSTVERVEECHRVAVARLYECVHARGSPRLCADVEAASVEALRPLGEWLATLRRVFGMRRSLQLLNVGYPETDEMAVRAFVYR